MARRHKRILNKVESVSGYFTNWVGSPTSIAVHTVVFIASFALIIFGVDLDTVLLTLTTAVSLEAIYLALFIQMTVNKNTQSMADIEEDIEEIAEDVEEIEKDIDEIEKDIDEMQEDVEEIERDSEEDDLHDEATIKALGSIQSNMLELMKEIQALKQQKK